MAEPLDLSDLERLAKEATPGPWHADFEEGYPAIFQDETGDLITDPVNSDVSRKEDAANAAFIGAANPAVVLELIALARSAEEMEKRLRELIEAADEYESGSDTLDHRLTNHRLLAALDAAQATVRSISSPPPGDQNGGEL